MHGNVFPARQVAGDFFDFFKTPSGKLAFFIGDVSGKGMPAALYMIAVRTLCRHVAREVEEETGLMPADFVAEPHFDCVFTGVAVAMMQLLHVDLPGEILRRRIEANLAQQRQPELSAIHLVRGPDDYTSAMPGFVTAFLDRQFAG